jgi:signal transduction histidine kinase
VTGWWRRRSLRLRLTIVATGVLALGLTVGVLGLSALFARARTADLDTQIQTEASTLHALVSSDQLTQPLPVPPGSPVLAQVVDSAGTVLASTPSAGRVLPIAPPAELASLSGRGPTSADETGFGAGQLRLLVESATLSGTPVHVVVAASVADLESTLGQLRRVVLVVTPLVVLAAGLAAWYALGAALRPVDEMAAAAQELGAADDPTRPERTLPVPPTDDELARLAVTLNDMLERLRASARQQRDFAADAAHELRTPLTTLLAGLDVARSGGAGTDWDAASATAVEQARRLTAIIDDLLLLARTDADRLVRADRVDVGALVAEVAAAASDGDAVPVLVHVPDAPLEVAGDQAALERTMRNLLDNGRRHATSGVVVDVRREGTHVVVTVADDGRGVPDDELDAIFTRFHRVDAARSRTDGGTGLGLAIVRGVARSHGGDAVAGRGPDGGLSVRVTLDAG